jgi:hypothetical protein
MRAEDSPMTVLECHLVATNGNLRNRPGWLRLSPVATRHERDNAQPVHLPPFCFRVAMPPFYPRRRNRMDGVHRTDTFLRLVRLTASPSPPGNHRATRRNRLAGEAYARCVSCSLVGPDDSCRIPLPISKGTDVGGARHLQLHCKCSTQLRAREARFPSEPLELPLKPGDLRAFPSFI